VTEVPLRRLRDEFGQSAWLDNLTRRLLRSGELERLVARGICGVTSNPTIFQKAISESDDYDDQFGHLVELGATVDDAYWTMVIDDVIEALEVLRPIHEATRSEDGFVSLELAPRIAHDASASITTARDLHKRISAPNLFVKIPATAEGVPAVRQMISEGRNINITLLFGLRRYGEIIDAYLTGLEAFSGDCAQVHSVASFFVSRVDTEVDRRLDQIDTDAARALRGQAAIAHARLAYQLFRERFSGSRWETLAARGARVQRPLWASTSTKNPAYGDTRYIDELIGPDSVTTMPDATLAAFEDHGTLACTIDRDVDEARRVLDRLGELGIEMEDVAATLEEQGVAAFGESYDGLLAALETKRASLTRAESDRHA
jgi:transaldolase